MNRRNESRSNGSVAGSFLLSRHGVRRHNSFRVGWQLRDARVFRDPGAALEHLVVQARALWRSVGTTIAGRRSIGAAPVERTTTGTRSIRGRALAATAVGRATAKVRAIGRRAFLPLITHWSPRDKVRRCTTEASAVGAFIARPPWSSPQPAVLFPPQLVNFAPQPRDFVLQAGCVKERQRCATMRCDSDARA
jgi:hypothetical protein